MYVYDSSLVMTSIKAAEDFFKTSNLMRGLSIKVDRAYKSDEVKKRIREKLGNQYLYSIMSWMDLNQNFLHALKLEKTVMFIVVTMTTVVAAFGIISALIMSVMSKMKDIAILRSIGATAKSVLMIFMFQGIGIGFVGIVLGLLGGISLSRSLNRIIDVISGLIGRSLIPKDVYYFDKLPTSINMSDIGMIMICAFVISLLASLYPAYQASRINLSEALRHE
jgi:lipoprotein-releasing system permease protein